MDTTDDSNFNSKTLSIWAQKKILGKMASRNVAKHFVSDDTARLLDRIYRILKDFYGKKCAEKIVKNIIKMIIKLAVLSRNEQFSSDHSRIDIARFQRKFRSLVMTVISFHDVEFSYDRNYLLEMLADCQHLMQTFVKPYLSDKSTERIHMIFCHVARTDLLDALFRQDGRYRLQMGSVCEDLRQMMDIGEL